MASVSILQQPPLIVPAYNDSFMQVSSPQSTEPLFNFIFRVWTGTTLAGTPTTIIAPASPDGSCYFSPFGILKDWMGYDLTHDIVGWTQNTYCALNWAVGVGVQYAVNSTTGVTQYIGLEAVSGFCWNAAMRYEQYSGLYNYENWTIANNTYGYLTNMPNSVVIQNNEMASLSVLVNPFSAEPPTQMLVQVYQNSGGTRNYWVNNRPVVSGSSTLAGSCVQHFGSGIWNLNQLTSANTLTALSSNVFPIFNPNIDYQYSCQVYWRSGEENTSETTQQFYILDPNNLVYNSVRLMWLNPYGGFDYFSFTKVSRLTETLTRNTYKQNLTIPSYQIGDRGTTTTYNDVQEGMTINSNWIDDQTSMWLEDCFNSGEVYILNPDGTIYPIIFTTTPQEIGRFMNDQELVQIQIEFVFAYKVNIQTGSYLRSKSAAFGTYNGGAHNDNANYQNRGGYPINTNYAGGGKGDGGGGGTG